MTLMGLIATGMEFKTCFKQALHDLLPPKSRGLVSHHSLRLGIHWLGTGIALGLYPNSIPVS